MNTDDSPCHIAIADYDYQLPEERIALYPAEKRDESKLLVYAGKSIRQTVFKNIHDFLPEGSLLLFNDTKVIHARILVEKQTGSTIEIFCLEPVAPKEIQQSFHATSSCSWKCFVGNNKRWKEPVLQKKWLSEGVERTLFIQRITAEDNTWIINFSWNDNALNFARILEELGKIPLPPYIHRDVEMSDNERYQTIFARQDGSVAAPTAGLHFTEEVMNNLKNKGVDIGFVTLHVGAGTFKPVSAATIGEHQMHEERVFISKSTIEKIIAALDKTIIPVGTTCMRTIESLYWFAAKLMLQPTLPLELEVAQWDPYTANVKIDTKEALSYLLKRMNAENKPYISGTTSLMIAPPYSFKIAKGIITNFHQPKSTLLLLVSAMIGSDWKKIYSYAMANDFRFLSFGDANLILL